MKSTNILPKTKIGLTLLILSCLISVKAICLDELCPY